MGHTKGKNTKRKTYHFFIDMINVKDFNSSLLKSDKKLYLKLIFIIMDTSQ